ncbi:hypothetical protein GDO78_005860 [Eleutherodactylus coqui]|uniref:Uncharacterized protein n=1 Tax=Eleutherodactylus coqui TaxID=57060 RepID=A0A8J6FMQ5_ELECQ|nr:hypothetical protein GDO78_005860 [Eleutherodactylus coqui]
MYNVYINFCSVAINCLLYFVHFVYAETILMFVFLTQGRGNSENCMYYEVAPASEQKNEFRTLRTCLFTAFSLAVHLTCIHFSKQCVKGSKSRVALVV